VVHCPGSHAWFERPPAPLERYVESGVRLALGTDSLASNEDLDLRLEMVRVRKEAPWLAPAEVWAMATRGGAAALDAAGELGVLTPGARADMIAHRAAPGGREAVLEQLTSTPLELAGGWVDGGSVEPA
jgi:cytosine/adenosine deaminase-related metal-dependent hydrolase